MTTNKDLPDADVPNAPPEPFTMAELQVIASGLDVLVRSEGNGIANTGINGLAGGRVQELGDRFMTVLSATRKAQAFANHLVKSQAGAGSEG